MKLTRILQTMVAVTLAAAPVQAQDFYNGLPGPTHIMIDSYATIVDGKASGMVIPKLFMGRLLLAAPFSVSEDGVENKGGNIGLIAKNLFENTHAIAAAGLFKDGEGEI